MSSNVYRLPHYNSHPSGIECIDIAKHLSFDMGNALKYVMRHDHKGSASHDIQKAIQYLGYEIGCHEQAQASNAIHKSCQPIKLREVVNSLNRVAWSEQRGRLSVFYEHFRSAINVTSTDRAIRALRNATGALNFYLGEIEGGEFA